MRKVRRWIFRLQQKAIDWYLIFHFKFNESKVFANQFEVLVQTLGNQAWVVKIKMCAARSLLLSLSASVSPKGRTFCPSFRLPRLFFDLIRLDSQEPVWTTIKKTWGLEINSQRPCSWWDRQATTDRKFTHLHAFNSNFLWSGYKKQLTKLLLCLCSSSGS